MKGIPPEFDEPLFKRLFLLAEICNFTPGELEQYYKSLNNMGDYYNILHTAKEEAERIGLERGLAKGIEQGRAEERAAIISLLSANGMDDESISKMLEMDLDVVRRITSNAATGK
jgi:predicted transposase YdaD